MISNREPAAAVVHTPDAYIAVSGFSEQGNVLLRDGLARVGEFDSCSSLVRALSETEGLSVSGSSAGRASRSTRPSYRSPTQTTEEAIKWITSKTEAQEGKKPQEDAGYNEQDNRRKAGTDALVDNEREKASQRHMGVFPPKKEVAAIAIGCLVGIAVALFAWVGFDGMDSNPVDNPDANGAGDADMLIEASLAHARNLLSQGETERAMAIVEELEDREDAGEGVSEVLGKVRSEIELVGKRQQEIEEARSKGRVFFGSAENLRGVNQMLDAKEEYEQVLASGTDDEEVFVNSIILIG